MGELTLEEKRKLLSGLVKKTQAKHGGSKHVLSFASDRLDELKYDFIPTPSENINMALGDGVNPGGFARGKIGEVAGESGSGKTSLMLETIGLDHKNDPDSIWAWLDSEADFDSEYAASKGVDPERLILWEVDDQGAESGLDTLEMIIRSGTVKGAVINSIAGLTPKVEMESEMDKQSIALQARMMSKLMRKITAITNRTKTSVIFINQLRTNVGVMYGNPDTTPGGRAVNFYSTQRIALRKVKLKSEDGITEDEGIKINVRISKNRVANDNPYKATSYTALFGKGIDAVREIAQLAVDAGVVTGGTWVYYPNKENVQEWNGEKLAFNGRGQFINFLRENDDFKEHLRGLIHGKVSIQTLSPEEIAAIEAEEKAIEAELGQFDTEE